MTRFPSIVAISIALLAVPAASQTDFDAREHYIKSEVMIPMRDGVELFTQIYEPKDRSRPSQHSPQM